jgi:hypothetical protein
MATAPNLELYEVGPWQEMSDHQSVADAVPADIGSIQRAEALMVLDYVVDVLLRCQSRTSIQTLIHPDLWSA